MALSGPALPVFYYMDVFMNLKKPARILFFCLALLLISCFVSCQKKAPEGTLVIDKDTSYAFGMYMAEQWSLPIRIQYDYKAYMEGFRDFTEQQEARFSMAEAYMLIQNLAMMINEEIGRAGKEEEEAFFAANAEKPGVKTTASGLQYEVLVEGTGAKPGPYSRVLVDYQGTLLDGTIFDSSYSYGEPVIFGIYEVISGWAEGLQLMSEGSIYRLFIPSALAYGLQGAGNGLIPPNAGLIFMVELLGVED